MVKVYHNIFEIHYCKENIIRYTILLPPSFFDIRGFSKTGYIFRIKNIFHRWPLLSSIFWTVYESRIQKTTHLLRRSTHRSNFLLFHKNVSIDQPGDVPLIETNDRQREQCLKNMAGGVGIPISTFSSMF